MIKVSLLKSAFRSKSINTFEVFIKLMQLFLCQFLYIKTLNYKGYKYLLPNRNTTEGELSCSILKGAKRVTEIKTVSKLRGSISTKWLD